MLNSIAKARSGLSYCSKFYFVEELKSKQKKILPQVMQIIDDGMKRANR